MDQFEHRVIGLGDMEVSDDPSTVLICLGLGSCIAFCAYDSKAKVGGMAHIVLPFSEGRRLLNPGKFADTAIPALVDDMCKLGASIEGLDINIVGGAHMPFFGKNDSLFNTGQRNIEAVNSITAKLGMKIASSVVGGGIGRTARLFIATGEVKITSAGVKV